MDVFSEVSAVWECDRVGVGLDKMDVVLVGGSVGVPPEAERKILRELGGERVSSGRGRGGGLTHARMAYSASTGL